MASESFVGHGTSWPRSPWTYGPSGPLPVARTGEYRDRAAAQRGWIRSMSYHLDTHAETQSRS